MQVYYFPGQGYNRRLQELRRLILEESGELEIIVAMDNPTRPLSCYKCLRRIDFIPYINLRRESTIGIKGSALEINYYMHSQCYLELIK
jgi:hypothetical protein